MAQLVKNPPAMQGTWVGSLSWEDPLEKGKATHSSVLAWRSPVVKNLSATAGEPRGGGSIPGLGKIPWRRAWKPTQIFLPEGSHGQRSLAGYGP